MYSRVLVFVILHWDLAVCIQSLIPFIHIYFLCMQTAFYIGRKVFTSHCANRPSLLLKTCIRTVSYLGSTINQNLPKNILEGGCLERPMQVGTQSISLLLNFSPSFLGNIHEWRQSVRHIIYCSHTVLSAHVAALTFSLAGHPPAQVGVSAGSGLPFWSHLASPPESALPPWPHLALDGRSVSGQLATQGWRSELAEM